MYETYEIFALLTGTVIAMFLLFFRKAIAEEPLSRWLILSFSFFFLSRFFTVVEGMVLESFFNLLEHLSYLAFTLALLRWVLKNTTEFQS